MDGRTSHIEAVSSAERAEAGVDAEAADGRGEGESLKAEG